MDAAFASIAFVEPARAEANLSRLESRLSGKLWTALPGLLAQVPDPDAALNYLERFVHNASDSVLRYIARNPSTLHHLLVVFSYSRFLSETITHQPELIQWLHRPGPHGSIERIKTQEDLHEEFARFEAVSLDQPPAVILARFKRREYLRIMLRDVLGLATLAETTMELSDLADVLLERALRADEQKLHNAYGTPQFVDEKGHVQSVRLAILSLGKLGARELNYNSDIDLMFVYKAEGETSGGARGAIGNSEFFVRLTQAVLKTISEVTPEGAVFRVDLRLRPQGKEGVLAVSLPAALDYYRTRAREWELQMLIKARCSAGDAEASRRFLDELHALIFPPGGSLNPAAIAAVEAVLNARQEMTRELRRRAGTDDHVAEWNVKLSPGGIRDIEFLVQCLQRVHGGQDSWLANPAAAPTLVALQRLHDKGYLSGRDFFRLGTAYQFLRRVEHRLQLRDGLQRHTLPGAPDALDRLARRCGVEAAGGRSPREQFLNRIQQHFTEVRAIYAHVLRPESEEPTIPAGLVAELEPGEGALLLRLRQDFPNVARQSIEELSSGDAYARRGLQRFLSSAVLSPACMRKLEANADWISRAAVVFARSDLLTDMLSRHPEEIAFLAAPEQIAARTSEVSKAATQEQLRQLESEIRVRFRRRQLAAVVRAVEGAAQPFETFAAFTQNVDEALSEALRLALAGDEMAGAPMAQLPFSVIALGRLGTGELDIGSDADLIFVVDESLSAEQREPWRRAAERFVHLVSSHTREGLLLPVDTRLRPRGSEGEIVHSMAYLRDYCRSEAEAWEAISYLKARPVAGNLELGASAIEQARSVLLERFQDSATLAARLAATRQKLEIESSGVQAKGEFKKLSGGFYDVEYIVGYLFLTRRIPPVNGHILRQIAALESAGAFDTPAAQTLRSAALLYRSVDHAVRLITGRSAHHLPEPALAGRVMRLFDLWRISVPGDAAADPYERLVAAISASRTEVRALYQKTVLASQAHPADPSLPT